jgi:hypothetical protein
MAQPEYIENSNDEIDLAELFSNLWKKRLVVLLISIVGGLIGGSSFLISWLSNPSVNTASVEVRFNFPSIQNGTYPNGQSFSLNDIIAPAILNQVYDNHQVDQLGIARDSFLNSIQITPFAVNRAFIDAKFKAPLSNSKLTPTEIDELNNNYAKALAIANLRFAKINFSVNATIAIPSNTLHSILVAIPETWAKESIENYGVLDIAIAKPGEIDRNLIDNYEYIVAAQYLDGHLAYITRSAEALKKDEIGRLQTDSKTGHNIDEILEQLANLKNFHMDVLLRTFALSPVARNIDEARFYLQNQINSLQETLNQLNRQATVVNDAYTRYNSREKQERPSEEAANQANYGYTAQYGDEFLSKLMSIGDQLSDATFKQTLLNRSLELKLEAEQIMSRINRLQANLDTMKADTLQNDIAVARVKKQVNYITEQLDDLGVVIGRIADLRSQRVLGQSGSLYDLNSEPRIASTFMEQSKALIKFSALGLLAGFFLGGFLALILAVVRKPKTIKGQH